MLPITIGLILFILGMIDIILRIIVSYTFEKENRFSRLVFAATPYLASGCLCFTLFEQRADHNPVFHLLALFFGAISMVITCYLMKNPIIGRAFDFAASGLFCFMILLSSTFFLPIPKNYITLLIIGLLPYLLWYMATWRRPHTTFPIRKRDLILPGILIHLTTFFSGGLNMETVFSMTPEYSEIFVILIFFLHVVVLPIVATVYYVRSEYLFQFRWDWSGSDMEGEEFNSKENENDTTEDNYNKDRKKASEDSYSQRSESYERQTYRHSHRDDSTGYEEFYRWQSEYGNRKRTWEGDQNTRHRSSGRSDYRTKNVDTDIEKAFILFKINGDIRKYTRKDIDREYKKLMKQNHPDSPGGGNLEMSQQINNAHDLIIKTYFSS